MPVKKEFSRFAHEYGQYNQIQTKVAQHLVDFLDKKDYNTLMDIGCGRGAVYEALTHKGIEFENFYAVDFSAQMLELHPNHKVKKVCANFNTLEFTQQLKDIRCDTLLSSSALQWSSDLHFSLSQISSLCNKFCFAIFTDNTFKTLHTQAGITSPIHSSSKLLQEIRSVFTIEQSEIVNYTLHFAKKRDIFDYIKKSGVSGGERRLDFRSTKRLMETYELGYLEFEVLFVKCVV